MQADLVFCTEFKAQPAASPTETWMAVQSEMDFLPEILLSVSPSKLQRLQQGVRDVWHRFMYKELPLFRQELLSLGAMNQQPELGQYAFQVDPRLLAQVGEDDAFTTIMQWLHERMMSSL